MPSCGGGASGDLALRIPEDLVITLRSVFEDGTVAEILTTGKLSELACLTLYLMYEKKMGRDSVWYPYIKVGQPRVSARWPTWGPSGSGVPKQRNFVGARARDHTWPILFRRPQHVLVVCEVRSSHGDSRGAPVPSVMFVVSLVRGSHGVHEGLVSMCTS